MPRPKSDIIPVHVKLGGADRAALDELAQACVPPTRTEAVRQAIRRWHQEMTTTPGTTQVRRNRKKKPG